MLLPSPSHDSGFTSGNRFQRGLFLAAFLIPVALYTLGGAFSRFIADDYCVAQIAGERTAWDTFQYYYHTWSGRFSYYVVTDWLIQLGPVIYSLVPVLLVGLWFAAVFWLIRLVVRDAIGWQPSGYWALLFTGILMYGILAGVPNLEQSIYWVTGAVTYVFPLLLLTIYAALTLKLFLTPTRQLVYLVSLMASAFLAFVAVGFSETTAGLQVFMIGCLVLWALRYAPPTRRVSLLVWLSVGLICSLVALALMAGAPGNAIRRAAFSSTLPLPEIGLQTVQYTLAFIGADLALFATIPVLVILFTATGIGYILKFPERYGHYHPARGRRALLIVSGLGLAVTAVCTAPSIYVMSAAPPARVYLLPHTFLVVTVLVSGLLLGFGLRSGDPAGRFTRARTLRIAAFGLLILVLAAASGNAFQRVRTYSADAQAWDARDALIRNTVANGTTAIEVPPLDSSLVFVSHLEDLTTDASNSINQCAAGYYHVTSLTVADAS